MCATCPTHLILRHPNNIRWRIQAVKFIIMQISPRSVFFPLRTKYLPQKSSQKPSVHVPSSKRTRVAPIHYPDNITILSILVSTFVDMRREDKRFWTE
jgi:hypothetical protein